MILTEPEIRSQFPRRLRLHELQQFLEHALAAVKMRGEVAVLLTGDRQIRRWNRELRGKNKPTDVLSFPAPALDDHRSGIAGDLAISVETADRQAAEHGHTLAEELKILMLHGLLHLAGYDHEADDGEMARKEQRLRVKLGLNTGLIERAVPAAAVRGRRPAGKSLSASSMSAGKRQTVPARSSRVR